MTDHDHECGCGHDHDHGDDEIVEIVYTAREDVLDAEGISAEQFSDALDKAIDAYETLAMREDVPDEDVPAMEDVKLAINGKEYRLGDLAEVTIEGDFDDEDFDEDEDAEQD